MKSKFKEFNKINEEYTNDDIENLKLFVLAVQKVIPTFGCSITNNVGEVKEGRTVIYNTVGPDSFTGVFSYVCGVFYGLKKSGRFDRELR